MGPWRDARQAVRALARRPVLTVAAVLSLAAGIGMNTVVFSWLDLLLRTPVPGVDASDLVLVEPRTESGGYPGTSWPELLDLRRQLRTVQGLAASRLAPLSVGEPGRSARVFAQLVSDGFFETLRLPAAQGRVLGDADGAARGGAPVAVVSDDFWRTRLGGTADVVGRPLRVNGLALTVVGVTPPRFQGTVTGIDVSVWVPATLESTLVAGSRDLDDRGVRGYSAIGRLAPGATRPAAQAESQAAMAGLARAFPDTNTGVTAEVLAFAEAPRGPQRLLAQGLVALQVLLLLLLAAVCANLASLLLARGVDRRRELGVRLALGASRAAVLRALAWEPLLLAAAGTLLGVAFAAWGTEAMRAVPLPGNLPFRFQTEVGAVATALAALLGLACAALAGVLPAWSVLHGDPQGALRGSGTAARIGPLRRGLIAVQVALALVVLIAAGLIVRGVLDGRGDDPGFRRDGLVLAAYDLTGRPDDPAVVARRVLRALSAAPGMLGAAIASSVPLDIHGLPPRAFTVDGRVRGERGQDRVLSNVVTPGYFAVMAIPVLAGRDFVALEDATAPAEAVVNAAFVDRYLSGLEPLGRTVRVNDREARIVGVVRTTTSDAFGEPPTPVVYLSLRDRPARIAEVHVHVAPGAEAAAARAVRAAVDEVDASLPVYDVRTMREHLERNLVFRLVPARMMAVLAPLLLLVAALGIYGVVAHVVAQRTAEIGVRLALGATARRVVAEVVGETMTWVAVGTAAGLGLALVVVLDLLDGGPREAWLLGGVPLALLAVAAVAAWLPARHAAAVDPVRALRHD